MVIPIGISNDSHVSTISILLHPFFSLNHLLFHKTCVNIIFSDGLRDLSSSGGFSLLGCTCNNKKRSAMVGITKKGGSPDHWKMD
uniref:Uncharacterized protein n=1 Tax=Salix viminalis TaxID=40686 RepID=A0A6N2K1A7_SALVM